MEMHDRNTATSVANGDAKQELCGCVIKKCRRQAGTLRLLQNGDAGQELCGSVTAKRRCQSGTLQVLLQHGDTGRNSVVVLLQCQTGTL